LDLLDEEKMPSQLDGGFSFTAMLFSLLDGNLSSEVRRSEQFDFRLGITRGSLRIVNEN
jgi:hypothetical protein